MRGFVTRLVLWITGWGWVRWIFTKTRVGRRVALRFVAGESLDEAIEVAREANRAGMTATLAHLGEHVTDVAAAEAARDAALASVDRIAAEGLDCNVSIKPTHLGMGLDDDVCAASLRSLAARAKEAGITVTVDMESSVFTAATLDLYEAVQREFGNLGLALQAYLHRTPADLERIAPLGGHVRLCKGAYDEPEAIAYRSRSRVDAAYDSLCGVLMGFEETRPAIASHDEARLEVAVGHAAARTAPWEIQMLYGIRDRLQRSLVDRGLPLRVYIPYGDAWYPYLTRRMAERPANLWFFLRALLGR